ncbi:M23 family metallopeptidase [Microbacterium resistens]|uniref:M23 family metallopeptidase n=1 Tax=Microbacterium resistens TaxID=156977 RepID=A0ABY3RTT5_9MICO|nr:M23 family metallopeptidase [Microbacterium resistens]UGS26314.1 M23 family metallopeptidase [Microbacterium resistens]
MPRRPSPGNLSDPYGWRTHPIWGGRRFHAGLDIGWLEGRTLVAPENGVVVGYGWQGGWGKRLDFQGDSGVLHYLAHTADIFVAVGTRVAEGTPIAEMGATGDVDGVHLHWEVRPGGGSTIDPEQWLRDATPTTPSPAPVPEEDIVMSMITTRWNGQHIFTVGPRFLEHETDIEQARQAGWLLNRDSRMGTAEDGSKTLFVEVGNDGLNRIQRTFGIPWYAFDLVMAGRAFDLEGNFGRGRIWSKEDEALAAVQGVQVRTDGLAKSLDELIAKVER